MTTSNDLSRHANDAAARFLETRGYIIVQRDFETEAGGFPIIAWEDSRKETLVFVGVDVKKGLLPAETTTNRQICEAVAMSFLANFDECGMSLRFDNISLGALDDDSRALLRHHINLSDFSSAVA